VRLEGAVLGMTRRDYLLAVLDAYAAGIIGREQAANALGAADRQPAQGAAPTGYTWADTDGMPYEELRRLASQVTGHPKGYIQARWGTKTSTLRRLVCGQPVADLAGWANPPLPSL
jgi:uncharacterized protein YbjT (DUF2867 family)